MELENKPDFEQALARLDAWWRREIIDRPPVTVAVRPTARPTMPEKTHASLRDRWLDVEFQVDRAEARARGGTYIAEDFPRYEPSAGPELCATVFGAELEFGQSTTWSIPRCTSCREIPDIRPNLDNPYWNAVRAMTDASLERGKGKWITALPDLHTNGDLVAALRDPQQLCLDLADDVDSVRAACDYVTESGYALMYDDIWRRISAAGQPTTSWTPMLHRGRAYITNCDFICMISSDMFRRAILPAIVAEMKFLDGNFFHLDGPGALRHLDDLLDLPELDGLQWIYGAGRGPGAKWIDVYRRAQQAGKCLQLVVDDLDDARAVAEHLAPEGVWFCPCGSYSLGEAEAFVEWARRWSAGKRA